MTTGVTRMVGDIATLSACHLKCTVPSTVIKNEGLGCRTLIAFTINHLAILIGYGVALSKRQPMLWTIGATIMRDIIFLVRTTFPVWARHRCSVMFCGETRGA